MHAYIDRGTLAYMEERDFNIELGRYLGRLFKEAGISQVSLAQEMREHVDPTVEQHMITRDFGASGGRPRGIKPERLAYYLKRLGITEADATRNVRGDAAAHSRPLPAELAERIAVASALVTNEDDAREIAELLTRQHYRNEAGGETRGRRSAS